MGYTQTSTTQNNISFDFSFYRSLEVIPIFTIIIHEVLPIQQQELAQGLFYSPVISTDF